MRSRLLAVILAFGVCGAAVAQDASLPESDVAYLAGAEVKSPGKAFLYSAALPGMGQLYIDANRGFAYLIVEAGLLTSYALTQRSAKNIREDYFEEVRAGVTFDGEGSFDRWNEEDFEHATDYENWHNIYTDDGGDPIDRVGRFYWSDVADFKDADPQNGEFAPPSNNRLIAQSLRFKSNDRYKTARTLLGALIFNHLVSAVDARIAARRANRDMESVSLDVRPDDGPGSASVALRWNKGF